MKQNGLATEQGDAGEKDMAIVSRQDGDALDYEATRCKEVKAWADAQF